RFGGEEFLIVLPNTDATRAATAANRLRLIIAGKAFALDRGDFVNATASIGVVIGGDGPGDAAGLAIWSETEEAVVDRLLCAADQALYDAKAAGRNCVKFAPNPVSDAEEHERADQNNRRVRQAS
ncbi:MAG: diguanylate cyclase, partial [Boseongicola sp.]